MRLMDIKKIKPYPGNPRKNEDAIDGVARSIAAFGFRQPIVVDKDHVIIVGHTRYLAAQSLGLEKVPVEVAKDLSAAKVKAYRIADNKTGERSMWDNGLLKIELEEFKLLDIDIDIELTGFSKNDFVELELISIKNKRKKSDYKYTQKSMSDYVEKYEIIVKCDSESHQLDLLDQFIKGGLTCKAIVV